MPANVRRDTRHPHAYPPIEGTAEDLQENQIENPEDVPSGSSNGRMWPQYLACFSATMGSFVMGTAIGWSGPALSLIRDQNKTDAFLKDEEKDFLLDNSWFVASGMDDFVVTDTEANFVASLMPLGALFGGKHEYT